MLTRGLGVTPEHEDTQKCQAVLEERLNKATTAVRRNYCPETREAFAVALTAWQAARMQATDSAYETAYGPDPIDLYAEARGWLSDCFSHDDFTERTEEQIRQAIAIEYVGGWRAFAASCGGGS